MRTADETTTIAVSQIQAGTATARERATAAAFT
jgi:hypothetical protein